MIIGLRKDNLFYVLFVPPSKEQQNLLEELDCREEDFWIPFIEEEQETIFKDINDLSKFDISRLRNKDVIYKTINKSSLIYHIKSRTESRVLLEQTIEQYDELLKLIDRSISKEDRLNKKASEYRSSCDTIDYMDGSARLWVVCIAGCIRDFLKGSQDPRSLGEWANLTLEDVLDACTEDNRVEPSREDEFYYVTSREFIFNDDYRIDWYTSRGLTQISLEELLDYVIEVYQNKDRECPLGHSIRELRKNVAKASGNPYLQKKFK